VEAGDSLHPSPHPMPQNLYEIKFRIRDVSKSAGVQMLSNVWNIRPIIVFSVCRNINGAQIKKE
jgi:hypothetical protein